MEERDTQGKKAAADQPSEAMAAVRDEPSGNMAAAADQPSGTRTAVQKPGKRDLTTGSVTSTMLLFAVPMILGNVLQQCYNLADTWIVGKFVGSGALAAVGSAYTLMTFLTSILTGMCMGGSRRPSGLRKTR